MTFACVLEKGKLKGRTALAQVKVTSVSRTGWVFQTTTTELLSALGCSFTGAVLLNMGHNPFGAQMTLSQESPKTIRENSYLY